MHTYTCTHTLTIHIHIHIHIYTPYTHTHTHTHTHTGNIIPAIATTNAIAAATQVAQCVKVVVADAAGNGEEGTHTHVMALLKKTWILRHAAGRTKQILQVRTYVRVISRSRFEVHGLLL